MDKQMPETDPNDPNTTIDSVPMGVVFTSTVEVIRAGQTEPEKDED